MRDMPGISARRGRGRPTAVGVCAALVLTAGVVTVIRGTDPAAAATVLHNVRAARVVAAGRAVPARDGMVVPRGASVQTGPAGAARLVTQGRSVYVGAGTSLGVLDGVRERLDRGQLMIDSRRGPRLLVGTDAGDVRTPAGALTRVERAAALRVGVFDGAAEVTPAGRSRAGVRVAVHYQVQVPYGGLPQPTTALALRDDAWEQQLAADLVEADRYLNALGDTLDGSDGAAVLTASPAVYRTGPPPTGPVRGEQALAVALAQTARRGGPSVQARLAAVSAARGSNGSWGVVAAIVDAPATGVGALLDRLRRRGSAAAPAAPDGTAAAAQALGNVLGKPGARAPGASAPGAPPPRALPPGGAAAATGAGTAAGSAPTRTGAATSGGSPRPAPAPSGSAQGAPAPSSPAPAPPPGVVQTGVDTVLGLVPSPLAQPGTTRPRTAGQPAPTPTGTPLVVVGLPLGH